MFGFDSYTPITIGGLTYLGTWDAFTNSPFLASSIGGASGDYYVVSVAGTTNLDGINDWQVGDWALFNGSAWQKIDNSDIVGLQSLNGLTFDVQTFAVGTSGLDFNISSVSTIHTFNLPDASATNRGALNSTDWSTFNGKQNALGFTPVPETRNLTINGTTYDLSADRTWTISTGSSLTIKDEGSTLTTNATSIDFTGVGVTATAIGNAVTVNISGGAVATSNLFAYYNFI